MIGIIAAVTTNGVIGKDNKLPFNYPEDLKWFKKNTLNSVVIMGRKTFESLGKPLPKRENIVITSNRIDIPGITCFPSIEKFFQNEKIILRDRLVDYWFIGGARIYEEGMNWADKIYLTVVSNTVIGNNLVKFPWINPLKFNIKACYTISELLDGQEIDSPLIVLEYHKL